MIISASIRTDIPALYPEWFMNRLREGYVLVQNPRNPLRCSRVLLDPAIVDMVIFWTKNSGPIISYLPEIESLGYDYFFQVTITPYGKDIESGLPSKAQVMEDFCRISERIGPERIIWRYDPIIISEELNLDYHIRSFERMADVLAPYTRRCVISFVDLYDSVNRNTRDRITIDQRNSGYRETAAGFSRIASAHDLELTSCAEEIDLSAYGIAHGACVDRELIESILGCPIHAKQNPNRRPGCRCIEHVDIGRYDSCTNGCIYCYAVSDQKRAAQNRRFYDPYSPILNGTLTDEYIITDKQQVSLRSKQHSLF